MKLSELRNKSEALYDKAILNQFKCDVEIFKYSPEKSAASIRDSIDRDSSIMSMFAWKNSIEGYEFWRDVWIEWERELEDGKNEKIFHNYGN